MKWLKNSLLDALGISKTEANGLVVLILIMLAAIFIPMAYKAHITSQEFKSLDFDKMDELAENFSNKPQIENKRTADLPEEFKTKDRSKKKEINELGRSFPMKSDKKSYNYSYSVQPFDINTADTLTLKKVRGIGKVLSKRIIKYRDLLGGYASKAQLSEVYGLPDSVIKGLDSLIIIRPEYFPLQLNVNEFSQDQLSKHPYIGFREARAIVTYRYQHGEFKSLEELRKVRLLDSLKIDKLAPYLKF